jgi:hypothetical protein
MFRESKRAIILGAAGISAARAEPLPWPPPGPGGSCLHGYFTSGGYCAPSQGAQTAIPRRREPIVFCHGLTSKPFLSVPVKKAASVSSASRPSPLILADGSGFARVFFQLALNLPHMAAYSRWSIQGGREALLATPFAGLQLWRACARPGA